MGSSMKQHAMWTATALLTFTAAAAGQGSGSSALGFPRGADLTLLGPSGAGTGADARLTYQQRVTLRSSWTVGGLVLTDPLSLMAGVTAGAALAQPLGPVLVEPFLEVGAGWVDGRVESGSYDVMDAAGVRRIRRYETRQGLSPVGGAGATVGMMVANRLRVRLMGAVWVGRLEELALGGFRAGISLGYAPLQRRWLEHRLDRESPAVVLPAPLLDGHFVEVRDDVPLRVVAGDPSGIAEVWIDGAPAELRNLAASEAGSHAVPVPAVAAERLIRPPSGGRVVPVVVRDSGGQVVRLPVYVVGPVDRQAPALELVSGSGGGAAGRVVAVRATDPSGVVDATVGSCPVRPDLAGALTGDTALAMQVRTVLAPGDSTTFILRDQAGNETRLRAGNPSATASAQEGADPEWGQMRARATSSHGGARAVRILADVSDPLRLGLERVTAGGAPMPWKERGGADQVDSWTVIPERRASVRLEAVTKDGRRREAEIPVTAAAAGAGEGSLHALMVLRDTTEQAVRRFASLIPADRVTILPAAATTPAALEAAMDALAGALASRDAVLIFMDPLLLPPEMRSSAGHPGPAILFDPVVALSEPGPSLTEIGERLAALPSAVTLVSTPFGTNRAWGVQPQLAPGALPPPGCGTSDIERSAGLADLRQASLEAIVAGLEGAADRDGDGRILAVELLEHLGAGPVDGGAYTFDPFVVVRRVEVRP